MDNDHNVAVVLGASVGGLLAATALAETFKQIVLIERADLPDTPLARPSVPQGNHAHGLLAGGLDALDQLVPGLVEELARAGCPTGDNLRDVAWVFGGKRLAIGDSGVRGMTVSRPVLEHALRQRVRKLRNVEIRTGVRTVGLVERAGRIAGVHVVATKSGAREELRADLVVDATGRHSALPEWLAALGFVPPRTDEVALETRYVSRIYSRRPRHVAGAIGLLLVGDPACPRGGLALALDDQRWLVSQYALGSERPPTDHDGYTRFARRLAGPQLAELLEDAEPLSEPATLRFPSSIRRRYEALAKLPENLIVCADALSSFNPTFGQGITVAAKQALVLRALCRRDVGPDLGAAFQREAARIVDVAWNASVGRTFRFDGVKGRPTWKMRLSNLYLPKVIARAHEDPVVATAFLRAMHMVAAPESLFAPQLLLRVLAASRSHKRTPGDEVRLPSAATGER